MIQKEKQELMLKTAQKKYGKDIRVLSAEKNVLHFMTEELSVTYTCHNNGKIDERMRKRPKRKVAESLKPTGSSKPTTSAAQTSPQTSPRKKMKKETFQVGDRVRSLYSDTTYTITSVDNDTLVHVAEEGDLYGRIMTIADLVKIPKRKKLTK